MSDVGNTTSAGASSRASSSLYGDALLRELKDGWRELPNKTLFALALGGLRVRIMRSAVTMLSIVLAIAFLAYTGVTNYLTQNLAVVVTAIDAREPAVSEPRVAEAVATLLAMDPLEGGSLASHRQLAIAMGMAQVAAAQEELTYDINDALRAAEQTLASERAAAAVVEADAAADDVELEAVRTRVSRAEQTLQSLHDRQAALQRTVSFGNWLRGSAADPDHEAYLRERLLARHQTLIERLRTPGRLTETNLDHLDLLLPLLNRGEGAAAVTDVRLALADERQERSVAELRAMMRRAGVNIEQTMLGNPMDTWLLIMAMLTCAIGIANAMLMSVTERFREIGTMKCLGAQDGLVVKLFLLESAFLGVIGAAFGIVLGIVVALGGATLQFGRYGITEFPLASSVVVIAWSVFGGIMLSVVGATYPAFAASRMKPVDALRVDE